MLQLARLTGFQKGTLDAFNFGVSRPIGGWELQRKSRQSRTYLNSSESMYSFFLRRLSCADIWKNKFFKINIHEINEIKCRPYNGISTNKLALQNLAAVAQLDRVERNCILCIIDVIITYRERGVSSNPIISSLCLTTNATVPISCIAYP